MLHHTHNRRHTVVAHGHAIGQGTKLDVGHVFQFQRLAAGITRNDDVSKFLSRLQSTGIAHGVLVSHIALLTELTGGSLDILLGQHSGNVARHQTVLFHHVRLQPHTHGVGLHTR